MANLAVAVLGLADISRKYMVGRIWQIIVTVDKVKSQRPITLEEWDVYRDKLHAAQIENDFEFFEHFGAGFLEPTSAIAFALKHDVPSILPAAFYHLSFTRLDHNYDEIERYQGDRYGAEHLLAARWKLLDLQMLRRFLLGKEFLLLNFKEGLDQLAKELNDEQYVVQHAGGQSGLNRQTACGEIMRSMGKDLIGTALQKIPLTDINRLAILDGLREHVATEGLCDACWELPEDRLEGQRDSIWKRLPAWFEVE